MSECEKVKDGTERERERIPVKWEEEEEDLVDVSYEKCGEREEK